MPKHITNSEFKKRIRQKYGDRFEVLSDYKGWHSRIKVKDNKSREEFYVWAYNLQRGHIGKTRNHGPKLGFERASKLLSQISNGKIKLVHFSVMKEVATFECCKCGNFWRTKAYHVFDDSGGCPACATLSKGEQAVAEYLKKNKISFKPQFTFPNCKDKRTLPFDFAVFNKDNSLNCLIEYQGCQHFINPFQYCKGDFINKESVLSVQKHDAMKLSFCQKHGIKLIRINHPQTTNESNKHSFIANLVKRTLDKELKVS